MIIRWISFNCPPNFLAYITTELSVLRYSNQGFLNKLSSFFFLYVHFAIVCRVLGLNLFLRFRFACYQKKKSFYKLKSLLDVILEGVCFRCLFLQWSVWRFFERIFSRKNLTECCEYWKSTELQSIGKFPEYDDVSLTNRRTNAGITVGPPFTTVPACAKWTQKFCDNLDPIFTIS